MRLFVASSFEPGFVKNLEAIAGHARELSRAGAVKWTAPGNFHITYAFLGEQESSAAAAAARGIEAGLDGIAAFRISSGGLGFFPSSGRPSVLWAGIDEGAAELRRVAAKLAEGLAAEGLVFEKRFEPHVTIGRIKGALPDNFLDRAADFARFKKSATALSCVELLESVPAPGGPEYRRIYSKRLSGGGPL